MNPPLYRQHITVVDSEDDVDGTEDNLKSRLTTRRLLSNSDIDSKTVESNA